MLKKAYLLAKIGADTAENHRNIDKILPKKLATTPSPAFWREVDLHASRWSQRTHVVPTKKCMLNLGKLLSGRQKIVHPPSCFRYGFVEFGSEQASCERRSVNSSAACKLQIDAGRGGNTQKKPAGTFRAGELG